ncbi:MAG: PIN domain-containing protein [Candidatus Bathyarchaeia archaeon]
MKTKKILIDTSFLFIPVEFRIDIFVELERLFGSRVDLKIISPVLDELTLLMSSKSSKLRKKAHLTMEFARKCNLIRVQRIEGENVDDCLVREAVKTKYPVATCDKELRKQLRALNIPVVYLRQKLRVQLEG